MSSAPRNGRSSPVRARTLEYRQAMKDFHTMFPSLEKDIIECVLRANSGHVDSTIDQLLQLTQDSQRNTRSLERLYYTYDDSTDSSGSLSSELRDRLSSSDEDHPPKYTPHFEPPPPAFTFSAKPVELVTTKNKIPEFSDQPKRYRDWNPPMLGALPPDFLRIIPSPHTRSKRQVDKHASPSPSHTQPTTTAPSRHSLSSQSSVRNTPNVHSPKHRHLQRRRTTGEVNVVLKTSNSPRSSQQRMVMVDTPKDRMSSYSSNSHRHQNQRHHSSSPKSHAACRNDADYNQYVEDRKVALLLQNEEFLKELRRNEQFLQELNKGNVTSNDNRPVSSNPRDQFRPIHVDPLTQLPASTKQNTLPTGRHDNSVEDKAFNESLKHMSKSAKKSFNEIARRFTARRKSYKSMNNTIDPIFANCDDEDGR